MAGGKKSLIGDGQLVVGMHVTIHRYLLNKPTKSDSDVILCLQLLSKTLTLHAI